MANVHAIVEEIAEVTFGIDGNAADHLTMGWASAEVGFTWSLEDESQLVIPAITPSEGHEHWLELRLNPFRVPGVLDSQRLEVFINGVTIGKDTIRQAATLAYSVPHNALAGAADGTACIALKHPEFAQPSALSDSSDNRKLAFMLFRIRLLRRPRRPPSDLTSLPPVALPSHEQELGAAVLLSEGVPPDEIALLFDSLGHNCEFGMVQRKVQAEPLGLLRFSSINFQDLLAGLDSGFAGLGESLSVIIGGATADRAGEYMVQDDRYRLMMHSFTEVGQESPERVRARVGTHMRRLKRAFFEKLAFGDHIAVICRPGEILRAEAHALRLALQRFGDAGLFCVDNSERLPRGAVERLDRRLYHGKLDWFAPQEDVGQNDIVGWMGLCINARRLWRLEK